jgi:sodium-dependent dicarboxylate transporter 2/3/5
LCDAVPDLDAATMTLAVAIPAGLAFSLPISSPPNAICFSAGYYNVREVVRRGVILSCIALGVFLLLMAFYWPLLHLGGG